MSSLVYVDLFIRGPMWPCIGNHHTVISPRSTPTWDLTEWGPPSYQTWASLQQDPLDIFKLVHYEACMVGKRAVCHPTGMLFLSLLNGRIKFDSLWTDLEAMLLLQSLGHCTTSQYTELVLWGIVISGKTEIKAYTIFWKLIPLLMFKNISTGPCRKSTHFWLIRK